MSGFSGLYYTRKPPVGGPREGFGVYVLRNMHSGEGAVDRISFNRFNGTGRWKGGVRKEMYARTALRQKW